jgi:hypothetical protein
VLAFAKESLIADSPKRISFLVGKVGFDFLHPLRSRHEIGFGRRAIGRRKRLKGDRSERRVELSLPLLVLHAAGDAAANLMHRKASFRCQFKTRRNRPRFGEEMKLFIDGCCTRSNTKRFSLEREVQSGLVRHGDRHGKESIVKRARAVRVSFREG